MSLLRKLLVDNTPKDYIKFADPAVEKICAENWGDGTGITYAQAAKVKTLGDKFQGNTEITSFDELQYFTGLQMINYGAFKNCSSLAKVGIPDTVTSLGEYSFYNCTGLTGLFYAKNVTALSGYALTYIGAETIDLPNLLSMGYASCTGCNNLKKVIVPKLQTIDAYNLRNFPNLETVILDQDRITKVERECLYNCPKLKIKVEFKNIVKIYDSFLRFCYEAYGEVNFPKLEFLDGRLLTRSKINKVSDLGSITDTGYYSFGACAELTEAHFPATVKTIGNGFMYQCTALKVLVMNSESLSQIYTNEMFDKLPSDCKIYVPDASVDTYKGYDGFKKVAGQIFPLSEYVAEE